MTDNGRRTLCVRSRARIGFSEGTLTVNGDDKESFSFPMTQLRCVMIESQESSISSRALAELAAAGIRLIVCDERHDPILEGVPSICPVT